METIGKKCTQWNRIWGEKYKITEIKITISREWDNIISERQTYFRSLRFLSINVSYVKSLNNIVHHSKLHKFLVKIQVQNYFLIQKEFLGKNHWIMEVGRKVIFELIGRFLHTHVGIRGAIKKFLGFKNFVL